MRPQDRLDVYKRQSFECALTGDGSLSSIGLLARSGQNEYVVLDASERSLVLDEWLSIIASVDQNGVAPYAEVSLEDATPLLTPLLLDVYKRQSKGNLLCSGQENA